MAMLTVFGWLMWALSRGLVGESLGGSAPSVCPGGVGAAGRRPVWSPFAAEPWPLRPISQGRASQKFLVAPRLHRKPRALSVVTGDSDLMSRSPYRQHHHPPDCFVLTTLVFQQRIQARAWTDYFRKYRNEEMGLKVCCRQVFFFAVSNLGSSMSLAVYLG